MTRATMGVRGYLAAKILFTGYLEHDDLEMLGQARTKGSFSSCGLWTICGVPST